GPLAEHLVVDVLVIERGAALGGRARERIEERPRRALGDSLDADGLAVRGRRIEVLAERDDALPLDADLHLFVREGGAAIDRRDDVPRGREQALEHLAAEEHVPVELEERAPGHGLRAA